MLTQLRLQNFKGWQDTGPLPLKPITALFGPNGSGKTALLQAILLLKQTAESPNPNPVLDFGAPNTPTDLGDLNSIAHPRNPRNPPKISLDWKTPQPFTLTQRNQTIIETDHIGLDLFLRQDHQSPPKPAVAQRTYRVGPSQPAEMPADIDLALQKRLTNIHYLSPQRANPQRTYPRPKAPPTSIGQSGESAIDAILSSRKPANETAQSPIQQNPALEQTIAHWLKQTGLAQNFQITPTPQDPELFEVKVIQRQNGTEIPLADAGSGIAQILPTLTLCHYAPPGATVILNQPETHLHPNAQSALADLIIETHQTRQIQILIETHSEHLLNRLQRRIAEQKITADEISLIHCQPKDADCHLEPLNLDEYGNIKNWPKNFFGDQFGEVAAMTRAAIKRRLGTA